MYVCGTILPVFGINRGGGVQKPPPPFNMLPRFIDQQGVFNIPSACKKQKAVVSHEMCFFPQSSYTFLMQWGRKNRPTYLQQGACPSCGNGCMTSSCVVVINWSVVKKLGYFDPTFAEIRGLEYKFVEPQVLDAEPTAKPKPRPTSAGSLQCSIASYLQPAAGNAPQ